MSITLGKRITKYLAISLILTAGLWSCSDSSFEADESILDSIPDWEQFRLSIAGETPSSKFKTAGLGQTAEYYKLTLQTVRRLNPMIYGLLSFVDDIVANPPTRVEGDTRIWEADRPLSGLSAVIPRFSLGQIEKDGLSYHTYLFEIRHKNSVRADFTGIWWGAMTPDAGMARRGSGEMTLDFTAAAAIDPATEETGKIIIEYDIRHDQDRTISMIFEAFHPGWQEDEMLIDATYDYLDALDNTGSFSFVTSGNYLLELGAEPVPVDLSVETLWLSDGMGRSLVQVSGEGLEVEGFTLVDIHECWDNMFDRTFYTEWFYWDEENPPTWVGPSIDNPIENGDARQGDEASCMPEL